MSTPTSALGSMGNASSYSGPSQSLSSISSQGMPEQPTQESQESNAPNSPADTAIQRFGKVMEDFETLTKLPEYSSATKEADEVKRAMNNWINAVVAATSKLRGESPSY